MQICISELSACVFSNRTHKLILPFMARHEYENILRGKKESNGPHTFTAPIWAKAHFPLSFSLSLAALSPSLVVVLSHFDRVTITTFCQFSITKGHNWQQPGVSSVECVCVYVLTLIVWNYNDLHFLSLQPPNRLLLVSIDPFFFSVHKIKYYIGLSVDNYSTHFHGCATSTVKVLQVWNSTRAQPGPTS